MAALRRTNVFECVAFVVARVVWFAFGVTCAWSVRASARADARWDADDAHGARDDGDVFTARVDSGRLQRALSAVGVRAMGHVRESFDAHLSRVRSTLASWDVPEAVCVAGLGHTVYGSELFPVQLASFDRRRDVRAMVGAHAERYMFLYATASQKWWYRAMTRRSAPQGDGARSMTAVNFYSGQEMRVSACDAAMLSLMHAADIVSVLPKPPRATTRALAFVVLLIQSAAELLDDDGSSASVALAKTLRTRAIPDVLATTSPSNAHAEKASARRRAEAECGRLTPSLRSTRSDVIFVLRATGIL